MTDRRSWTKSEDDAILELVNKYGVKKWTIVSQKMNDYFSLSGRSGK